MTVKLYLFAFENFDSLLEQGSIRYERVEFASFAAGINRAKLEQIIKELPVNFSSKPFYSQSVSSYSDHGSFETFAYEFAENLLRVPMPQRLYWC
jgi:hypothetical protein